MSEPAILKRAPKPTYEELEDEIRRLWKQSENRFKKICRLEEKLEAIEASKEILSMTSYPGDKCPVCGAHEVPFKNPATRYACGSTDYDQQPGTFRQSPNCHPPKK